MICAEVGLSFLTSGQWPLGPLLSSAVSFPLFSSLLPLSQLLHLAPLFFFQTHLLLIFTTNAHLLIIQNKDKFVLCSLTFMHICVQKYPFPHSYQFFFFFLEELQLKGWSLKSPVALGHLIAPGSVEWAVPLLFRQSIIKPG